MARMPPRGPGTEGLRPRRLWRRTPRSTGVSRAGPRASWIRPA